LRHGGGIKRQHYRNLTDEEFYRFCLENKNLRIERNSNLDVIIISPVSSLSGLHSSEIFFQLASWSRKDGRGLVFDSSTGFTLPDRSVLSPDKSWMLVEKWNRLSKEDQDRFAPICPDFVIEVRSKTDAGASERKNGNVVKEWCAAGLAYRPEK
jgi:Uma2 family endonuclease